MGATAILLDSREPDWVKQLTFGGNIPVSVTLLPQGDAWISCEDGTLIIAERKEPDDLLGSIRDGRLFHQVAEMTTKSRWCYLIVTDVLQRGPGDQIITARGQTGWSFSAVQGALLDVQELGVFVVFSSGDQDYQSCLLRLANKHHDPEHILEPVKFPKILSIQESIIAALPGVGLERLKTIMDLFETPAQALAGLTDPGTQIPGIQAGIKGKIRNALKLAEGEQLVITTNQDNQEVVEIIKTFA